MKALLLLALLRQALASCHLHRPMQFLSCYTAAPDAHPFWLYAIIFLLVFLSTVLGLKIYACLRIGWIHPREDLPRFPPPAFQLQPPPEPLPRAPSVISYFNLTGGDE